MFLISEWHILVTPVFFQKGFKPDTNLDEIQNWAMQYGPVENVLMRRTKPDRKFKGSVFITYKKRDEAEQAQKVLFLSTIFVSAGLTFCRQKSTSLTTQNVATSDSDFPTFSNWIHTKLNSAGAFHILVTPHIILDWCISRTSHPTLFWIDTFRILHPIWFWNKIFRMTQNLEISIYWKWCRMTTGQWRTVKQKRSVLQKRWDIVILNLFPASRAVTFSWTDPRCSPSSEA